VSEVVGFDWIGSNYWIEDLFCSAILQNIAQTSELLKAMEEIIDAYKAKADALKRDKIYDLRFSQLWF
jgi:hypothetical protein